MAYKKLYIPNGAYELPEEMFRLYYRSLPDDAGKIDIVFFDSFGKEYPMNRGLFCEAELQE
jgi:hypothetical protein